VTELHPIYDYGAIGDCRSVALVSRDGSIDWLCWPRFESPSIFGALLDEDGGRWRLAPTAASRARRSYIENTNVLETRFDTDEGSVVVTDLMPVASEADKAQIPMPDHEILRIAECVSGEVELRMSLVARPNYGGRARRVRDAGALGVRIEMNADLLALRTDMPLEISADGRIEGRVLLRAGQSVHASLTYANEWPAVLPPVGQWSRAALARSVAWWREWASHLRYDGPCRASVIRSALALKLLVYAPSGAVVAAPTTSLPERIGGDLNWDYRYCWLRDASLTMRALLGLGCTAEAHAFVEWLLQATRLTQPRLRVLYDVHGNEPRDERVLARFSGNRGSRPVRLGNAAAKQFQLDVYGELIDAVSYVVAAGGALDRETQKLLGAFGDYVCAHWQEEDEGIWEPRSGRALHTHSRLLCWTALDRLLELHANGHLGAVQAERFAQTRDLIRREITERAWSAELESYVSVLDGNEMDASLLLLAWYGFEKPDSERMKRTYRRARETLGAGDALLYRYRDGDTPGEGAFGCCSFWGAEYLALGGGTAEEARQRFEHLCGCGNDLGLFAEEIDPGSGAGLGNFPQAFTHVALINAALSVARRLQGAPLLERREQLARPVHQHEQPASA